MLQTIRHCACSAALVISFATAAMANEPPAQPPTARFPLVDLHVDLSYQVNYEERDIQQASGQLVASELLGAGVYGLVLPLFVPHDASPTGPSLGDIERSYARMVGLLAATAPYSMPGCHRDQNRIRTWFSFEGAAPFAGHEDLVSKWVANGVRIWGLVHSHDNELASSAGLGMPRKNVKYGLSASGRNLVRAIHQAGGIVDVSHASDRAIADILELARQDQVPVVATHSNARTVAYHARNLTDAQIRSIAELGGVVGINFHDEYLTARRPAKIGDVVRHVRHIVGLVGINHVGIGSDFEGSIDPPSELTGARDFPNLVRELQRSGFSDSDVRQILSGNVLRILGCQGDEHTSVQ